MKNKISLPPERLGILCEKRGISLASLCINQETGGSRIDYKTLTKINQGAPVKDTTLQKLCDPLGVSWADLIDQTDAAPVTQKASVDFDSFEQFIPSEEAEIETLMLYLRVAARTRQKIGVAALSEQQENQILKFEQWLSDASSVEKESDQSFSAQIHVKRINRQFLGIQSELRRLKLKIMVARYKFWEVSDEFYNRAERTYCSTNILAIAIVSSAISSVNFGVDLGVAPPDSNYAISDDSPCSEFAVHVMVDGKYLGIFDNSYIKEFGGGFDANAW